MFTVRFLYIIALVYCKCRLHDRQIYINFLIVINDNTVNTIKKQSECEVKSIRLQRWYVQHGVALLVNNNTDKSNYRSVQIVFEQLNYKVVATWIDTIELIK